MAALNRVWDSIFPFMFLFSKFFFFHVMPTRSASRTAAEDAQRRKEQEEEEGMPPYSPFEIGTEGEGLSGGEERGEGSLVTEMDQMKESLRKMEERQNEGQQMMGGVMNLLQQMQTQLSTLSASVATMTVLQQQPHTPPPQHSLFPNQTPPTMSTTS